MLGLAIRKMLFKWGWDTGRRNSDVAHVLKGFVTAGELVLDAGCGEIGLASFLPGNDVVGADMLSGNGRFDSKYVQASILALPFSERSFAAAGSVDVLEHLPSDLRPTAVKELLRVVEKVAVISFPCGPIARQIDESYNRNLVESGMPVPDWLKEHLADEYPSVHSVISMINDDADSAGRSVETRIVYSERIQVTKYLRWAASRSRHLYIVSNIFVGTLAAMFPLPDISSSYRAILIAKFADRPRQNI